MFDVIVALAEKLSEANIPYRLMDGETRYIYYPQKMGYILRVRQYDDDSFAALHTQGGEYIGDYWLEDIPDLFAKFEKQHFKKKKAVDFIQEEIGRLQAISDGCPALSKFARNLNLLALEGKLARAYGREVETEQVMRIMLRRTKPNALLVGAAGCGKTAIVENLAFFINDARIAYLRSMADKEQAQRAGEPYEEVVPPLFKDTVIFDLDLSSMIGGTKYRGDFEERVSKMIAETEKNPNIVLFIDEVHQLNKIGASAEGGDGLGQLLKPALARGSIHCIGATTDAEVNAIYADSALARRFNKVKVLPLGGEKAVMACTKIMGDYSKFHGVTIDPSVSAEELFAITQSKLKATAFPDNFINLLDETMAGAKFERKTVVDKEDFEKTVQRLLSADIVSIRVGF